MAETTATPTSTTRSCNHCGKTSSSLLRCSQCKIVHYCSRSCQSLAWKGGHRQACRKTTQTVRATSTNGGQQMTINATMVELMQHVQQMDCRTAYENMCRAQDEIERLKQQLDDDMGQGGSVDDDVADDNVVPNNRGGGTSVSQNFSNDSTMSETTTKVSSIDNDDNSRLSSKIDPSPQQLMEAGDDGTKKFNIMSAAHGSWLDEGGKCSIEYLPNIKCYHITLTMTATTHQSGSGTTPIIPKRDELQINMSPLPTERQSNSNCSSSSQTIISFYEIRLVVHHSSSTSTSSPTLLLTLILPGYQTTNHHDRPTATISTDTHSISLRMQFQQPIISINNNMDLLDILLGMEEGSLSSSLSSLFSPITTSIRDMNHLSCRECNSPILIRNNNNNNNNNKDTATSTATASTTSTIQSVLPLPSGYWDDIEDYLICYDGQANVDFSTSTMNAIRHVVLEDDAVLVVHKEDIIHEGSGSGRDVVGGVCTTHHHDVKGYGEHSSTALLRRRQRMKSSSSSSSSSTNNKPSDEIIGTSSSSCQLLWNDKSAMRGKKGSTVTCSTCCSTLGFVSGYDSNTIRFYKHLLRCGDPSSLSTLLSEEDSSTKNVFAKYSCASFLSREMVRYAENEAIYTFIVGVSDENDWTRLSQQRKSSSNECILLHMLSWDSALVGVDGGSSGKRRSGGDDDANTNNIRFEKVLKVIFDITTDGGGYHSSGQEDNNDRANKWTWGGIDLCCPPSMVVDDNDDDDDDEEEGVSPTVVVPLEQQNNNNNNNNNNNKKKKKQQQTNKATSVRIYLSTKEYTELKSTLTSGSKYFSEVVKDAIVLSKLKSREDDSCTSLSYLPLVN